MEFPERIWVTYLELREAPASAPSRTGPERICLEGMTRADYLDLYRRVGEPLQWDSRLKMPAAELNSLLAGGLLHIYVARGGESGTSGGSVLGLCEFERHAFPEIELRHFGLVPEAQGRGLGPWLLSTALCREWVSGAKRIWLHTDTWDHPAALPVYRRVGFNVYDAKYQAPEEL
jgi:GNAT superfamily N-acetyltransferase